MKTEPNALFYGDNLEVLPKFFDADTIDLIYLDPPFNSKEDYNVLFKEVGNVESEAQLQAFTDTWRWDESAEKAYLRLQERGDNIADAIVSIVKLLGRSDMSAYIVMMAIRLVELHKLLKETGSLYLHCDPTASHYLKVILDVIFDPRNFRNEIIWRRSHPKGLAFTRFASNHDVILVYGKDARKTKWRMSYREYDKEKVEAQYSLVDKDGRRYQLTSLLNPNLNRPHLKYEFKGVTKVWRWTKERMKEEDAKGRIVVPKGGKGIPRYKRYLDEQEGIPVDDFWDDIEFAGGDERLGYPTQKPLDLLERIIQASTNEGDWVLDPFCGCGTAILAAHQLKRKWFGIDITHLAITLIKSRLKEMKVHAGRDYQIIGEPKAFTDAEALAKQNKFQFEWWALSLIDANPSKPSAQNPKIGTRGAEGGVDGWLTFREGTNPELEKILVQVKGGENIGAGMVRDLKGAMDAKRAKLGLLITLYEPTEPMKQTAREYDYYVSPTWGQKFPKVQIITVQELLSGKKPNLPTASGMAVAQRR